MSVSESWNAHREALAVEALRASGRLRLKVRGESMLPTLWPGDVAEIEACSMDAVRPGDVVLASRGGRFYLHRLLSYNERGFKTRGDSMPGADPIFPFESLLGKVIAAKRAGKPVLVELRPWNRAVGLLFCHVGFMRRIALRLHEPRTASELNFADRETA
jgi:hypothetical protein